MTDAARPCADGYLPYVRPFAGRVNSGVSAAVDPTDGSLYVYGTDGRDLIEFRKAPAAPWRVTNLTGTSANRVFGVPAAAIAPDGDRQILQVNEDDEVIEYEKLAGTTAFSTRGPGGTAAGGPAPPGRSPPPRPGA